MHIIPRSKLRKRKDKVYPKALHIMANAYHMIALVNTRTGISHLIRADSEELEYLKLSGTGNAEHINYGEWLGKTSRELIHPDYREEYNRLFGMGSLREKICGGEAHQIFVYKCRRRVGGEYHWLQAEYVIRGDAGIPEEVLYYVSDVSDRWLDMEKSRRRAEEELQASRQENRIKTDFMKNWCQEARIPAGAIAGMNRLALRTIELGNVQKTEHYLAMINRLSEYLMLALTDIVDISRVQALGMPLIPGQFEIRNLTAACNEYCHMLIREKNISLMWTGELQGTYMGDEDRIRLALFNIIENAVKFNRIDGEIRISSEKVASSGMTDAFVVCVRDNGIGMTPEQKEKLFMPFARGGRDLSGQQYGTGTGLSVAKYVLDAMGGSIHIESEPDAGTIVTIEFSLQRAAAQHLNSSLYK